MGVTALFPAFHFRNAYSNLVQQFTDVGISALNPRMHMDSVRMLAGDVKGSFVSKIGRTWGYSEVIYEAKKRGVLADYRNIFETVGDKVQVRSSRAAGKSEIGKVFGSPKDLIRHPIERFKRMGGIIENESRLSLFTNYLRRGVDPEEAARRTHKVLFDYKKLSKVERDVLKRVFPFYTWTRKNIALQAERLIRNPGQAATQAKLTRQNRTDDKLLPKYLRGEMVFTLGTDEDGNINFIRGLDLPISDLSILDEPLRRLLTDSGPIPKAIGEIAMDREFFTGRKISENSKPLLRGLGAALDLLPERAKKAIDFTKQTTKDGVVYRMNPMLTHVLFRSWALSRTYGTAERLLRSKSLFSGENFLDLTTGFRLDDVDVDIAAKNIEREYQEALESEAVAKGKRRRFTKAFTPKERP